MTGTAREQLEVALEDAATTIADNLENRREAWLATSVDALLEVPVADDRATEDRLAALAAAQDMLADRGADPDRFGPMLEQIAIAAGVMAAPFVLLEIPVAGWEDTAALVAARWPEAERRGMGSWVIPGRARFVYLGNARVLRVDPVGRTTLADLGLRP